MFRSFRPRYGTMYCGVAMHYIRTHLCSTATHTSNMVTEYATLAAQYDNAAGKQNIIFCRCAHAFPMMKMEKKHYTRSDHINNPMCGLPLAATLVRCMCAAATAVQPSMWIWMAGKCGTKAPAILCDAYNFHAIQCECDGWLWGNASKQTHTNSRRTFISFIYHFSIRVNE